jgi:anti-sigma-K factor RskA
VIPWTVAVAAIAAALAFAFVYRGERDQAERLRRELAEAQATLARDDSTLSAFLGPEVHVVSLTATAEQKPRMRVFWNHTRRTFIVTALDLAPAPAGKTYQLWAIRKGKPPMSMGTFDPNPSGRTATTLAVAQDINDGGFIDDCALTVEPVGGSAQPTETPRLVGSWRHVD